MVTTVGLVGTGRMGTAMARALRRAGHPLVLYNRTRSRAEVCAAELRQVAPGDAPADTDIRVVGTPAEVARLADVTITMLADDAAVARVFGGPEGLLEGVRPATVLVDMSTVTPGTIRAFEGQVRAAGAGLLDAPVSGSTTTAEAGTLTLMVGGEAADLELARPALQPLARTIVHVGPLGAGAAMKLAVNTLIFGLNQALGEGLVLAEAAGIERQVAYDVLAASAAGAPYLGYKRGAFLDPEATPVAFALELAEKDLRLITGLAASLGVPVPQALMNLQQIRAASAGGRAGRDFSTVAQELRDHTGRPAAAPGERAKLEDRADRSPS